MLSGWLFTSAVAVSAIFTPSLAAVTPDTSDALFGTRDTINLLQEKLPPYDPSKDSDGLLKLTYKAIEKLVKEEKKNAGKKKSKRFGGGGCSLSKVKVRREWGSLSNSQKKSYTDAIKCLMAKPARSDPVEIPGAKSRYDDFVAVHIIQTLFIHATANFLHWHRWYVYLFEKALREECGYAGTAPYWSWGKSAAQPYPSHIFNDGEFGLSGDGEYIPHNLNGTVLGGGAIVIPFEPNGGGCVTTGPFANITVNLGPVAPVLDLVAPAPSPLAYNPRCLRRVISQYTSSTWGNYGELLDLLLNPAYSTIGPFQNRFQGDFATGYAGLHAAGHFTVGGDPGGDFFASPGEPSFWSHHSQVDRVWWLWQLQDSDRLEQIDGTLTVFNNPPSRNGTLEDTIEMGALTDEVVTLRDMISTTDGPFCYIYL